MPRRNKLKKEPVTHRATAFDSNFNAGCYGCPFAGKDFVCTTSDGLCLKSKSKNRGEDDTEVKRGTNRKGAER